DFHTEIVAQILRNSEAFTTGWLRDIGAIDSQISNVLSVKTQEKFEALDSDEAGSRVDMVIRLHGNVVRQIVFIESKLDSTENPGQLPKYSAVIAKQEGFDRSAVVFITRDFEAPRPPPVITSRWFAFYNQLTKLSHLDPLQHELKLFMEEHNMAIRNKFRSVDTLALESFLP